MKKGATATTYAVEKAEIIRLYQSGLSSMQVAERTSRCGSGVRRILERAGIPLRSATEGADLRHYRKLALDEEAFDQLNPEVGYWLGFMMADCGFAPRSMSVHLHSQDVNHLFKLKEFLRTEAEVISYTRLRRGQTKGRRFGSALTVCSKHLIRAVNSYGVVTRRTHTAAFSEELVFSRDVWRGVIDGDGNLSLRKPDRPTLSIVGSRRLMEQFLQFARTIVPTRARARPNGRIFGVQLTGSSAYKVIVALYSDALISLSRKQLLANEICGKAKRFENVLSRRYLKELAQAA